MKKLFLIILAVFSFWRVSYALDWRLLHEKADAINLAEAKKIVNADINSVEKLYILGLVYLNLHQDKEAGEVFEKIIGLDRKIIEAKWGIAEVLRRGHKSQESVGMLEAIISDNPSFAPAYISLAYIRYRQMNFNQSVKLAVKVIEQGRENVDLSNYVRAILIVSGSKGMIAHYGGPLSKIINGTAVFPALKKAEKLKPDDAAVLFGIGSFYLLAPPLAGGNPDRAEDYLKKAIKADPLFADVYVRLGQFYKLKGNNDKYNFYLNKALQIDPQNDLALDIKNNSCKFICLGN